MGLVPQEPLEARCRSPKRLRESKVNKLENRPILPCSLSSGAARSLLRGHAILDGAPELIPQLRRILMPVYGDGMLDRRLQELTFRVGADSDRAVHLAGECTAIDEFASHGVLLNWEIPAPSSNGMNVALLAVYPQRAVP